MLRLSQLRFSVLFTAALIACGGAFAQSGKDAEMLRVYANLLQVPVLVLGPNRTPARPVPLERFSISLNGAKPFLPKSVRLEGDDPLTLSILVDANGGRAKFMDAVPAALLTLAATSLRPHDRVSLFALDNCSLRRIHAAAVPDADSLRFDTDRLLREVREREANVAKPCTAPVRLWDALAWIADDLRGEPGRRVVLAVSNGQDGGSATTPRQTTGIANNAGVAIFTVGEHGEVPDGGVSASSVFAQFHYPSVISTVAESSGGLLMESTVNELQHTMDRVMKMVRGRYILEFVRPVEMQAAKYTIHISDGRPKDFIRPSGTSAHIASAEERDADAEHRRLMGAAEATPGGTHENQ